jgi:hypothetical protein
MSKKSKRRSKKNRIIVHDSKENVENATVGSNKPSNEKPTLSAPTKNDDDDDDLTNLVEQLSFVENKEQEETVKVIETVEEHKIGSVNESLEVWEQTGEEEIKVKGMIELCEKQQEEEQDTLKVKTIMEQAKVDLKNAGFPGPIGAGFDAVRGTVLSPALGLSADLIPAIASKIPLVDDAAAFALDTIFGAIKIGYGLVPHKESSGNDAVPSQ